jgi:septal ring factor EnvC (AmiA/AmiB activator)
VVDFCASAQAKADDQARQECAELQSLQDSNVKIQGEKDSLTKEVKEIDAQIKIAQQKIKVQERIISQLSKDIGVKSGVVQTLENKINRQIKSISQIIQKLNNLDSISAIEVFAGNKQLSEFYIQMDEYSTLNRGLIALVDEVKSDKAETEQQKQTLEDRKNKESDAKQAIESEKRLIDRKKSEKDSLLKLKTSESTVVQKMVTDQKQRVAQIRARLFKFQDGRNSLWRCI